MAFWNQKKKETSLSEIENLIDSGVFKELGDSINRSTESNNRSVKALFKELGDSINRSTESNNRSVKAFQDMTKALDKNTKELMRRR